MRYTINDLLTLMQRLREPVYGCPWDQVQTYKTIAPSTIEEAYEVVDAIEQNDLKQLREELGDLLFQVIFYSELGAEDELFNFDDIVSDLTAKLVRRHPHVFPEGTLSSRISPNVSVQERAESEANIKSSWEKLKANERAAKGFTSILDDIPATFPGATRAVKLQKRAASIGFDWRDISGVYDKVDEEIAELQEAQQSGDKEAIEDELGDLLFTVVNLARHLKVDPETALRRSNSKFEQRFRIMEAEINEQALDLAQLDEPSLHDHWCKAKQKWQNEQ